jgi:hypothetical protein
MTEIIEPVLVEGDAEQVHEYFRTNRATAVIDWRADDAEIVEDFSRLLDEGDELTVARTDHGLTITYHGVEHPVSLPNSISARYITIHSLLQIIAPTYQARLVRDSYYSDTHVFLLRRSTWWAELDRSHPERATELFQPVTEDLDFP